MYTAGIVFIILAAINVFALLWRYAFLASSAGFLNATKHSVFPEVIEQRAQLEERRKEILAHSPTPQKVWALIFIAIAILCLWLQ